MKKFLSILIGLFFIVSIALVAQDKFQTDAIELGRISSIKGKVFFQDELAEINMAVLEKDILTIRKGRVEIDLGQRNYVWLDKNTIVAFTAPQEESILLTILQGSICLRVGSKVIEVKALRQEPLRPEIGFYQIDVKHDKLKIDRDPRPSDPFISWSYKRKNALDRVARQKYLPEQADADYRYYDNYNYYDGYPPFWYSPWGLYPYLYPYWYPYRYSYWGFLSPFYYDPYYGGYDRNYYNDGNRNYYNDSRGRTVIHKNQLKKRNVSDNFTLSRSIINQNESQLKRNTSASERLSRVSKTGQVKIYQSRISKRQSGNTVKKNSNYSSDSPSKRFKFDSPSKRFKSDSPSKKSSMGRSSQSSSRSNQGGKAVSQGKKGTSGKVVKRK